MPEPQPSQLDACPRAGIRSPDTACVLALVALWLLVHVLLFRYLGAWVNDTGKEFGVPRDLLAGALLYRDTFWPYGPLPPYLNAGLLAVFGSHTDVLLIAARVLGLGICLTIYRTTRRFSGPLLALGAAVAALCLSTTSSCFAVPYSFATLWSCLLGLIGADCMVAALLGTRPRLWLLATGTCCALILLCKFTVALALGVPAALAALLLLQRRAAGARGPQTARLGACLLGPSLLVALPVYACFAARVRWDSFALQVIGGFHSFNIRHGLLYQYLWRTMTFRNGAGARDLAGGALVWGVLVVAALGPVCLVLAKRQNGKWGAAGCYVLFATLNMGQMNCTSHVPYIFPAALVAALWGMAALQTARSGQWGTRGLSLLRVVVLAGAMAVLAARLPLVVRKPVHVKTASASLRFAENPGRALARTVAVVQRESVPGEPIGIFTGHDFLYQILDRPNRLGYYYTLFEPFRRPWAEARFLRRFHDTEFRLLVTTTRESFSYAYILEIPETTKRICSQLLAGYEKITGPECLPYTVWRKRP